MVSHDDYDDGYSSSNVLIMMMIYSSSNVMIVMMIVAHQVM
jgi:hypothetical protein